MDYTSTNLLKHAAYSSKLGLSFDKYMTIMKLSKGALPIVADLNSLDNLKKLELEIDHVDKRIVNVLDYEMIVKDDDFTTVHVVRVADRCLPGR